jgi:hypothetical protein
LVSLETDCTLYLQLQEIPLFTRSLLNIAFSYLHAPFKQSPFQL